MVPSKPGKLCKGVAEPSSFSVACKSRLSTGSIINGRQTNLFQEKNEQFLAGCVTLKPEEIRMVGPSLNWTEDQPVFRDLYCLRWSGCTGKLSLAPPKTLAKNGYKGWTLVCVGENDIFIGQRSETKSSNSTFISSLSV